MFDIGWSEMAVIAVVALIVIGPRDLPKLLYTAGKMAAKARATLAEFQQGLADMAREAELDEVRKKIEAARDFNPTHEIAKALDPGGEAREALKPPVLDPEADADAAIAPAIPPQVTHPHTTDASLPEEPKAIASEPPGTAASAQPPERDRI